jgi:hypothetical protein
VRGKRPNHCVDVERKPLKRKTPLKRKVPMKKKPSAPKARKTLNPETARHRKERRAFHDAVFEAWGDRCFFCQGPASDAMHVIGRRMGLGKHRYAAPVQNGRPGCRQCHDELGDVPANFGWDVVLQAVEALNGELRIGLRMEQFFK